MYDRSDLLVEYLYLTLLYPVFRSPVRASLCLIWPTGVMSIFNPVIPCVQESCQGQCMFDLTYSTGVISIFNPILPCVQESCHGQSMLDLTYWCDVYIEPWYTLCSGVLCGPVYICLIWPTGVMSLFNPIIPCVQESCQGQCMFDLTCRLSYGQKLGDCGGFYQVKSDTFTLK